MKHTLFTLTNLLVLAFSAHAGDAAKLKETGVSNLSLVRPIRVEDLSCTKPDFWDQSDLIIKVEALPYDGLTITHVSKLLDGPCDEDLERLKGLISQNSFKLYLRVEAKTYVMLAPGNICYSETNHVVALQGHPLFGDYEFQRSFQGERKQVSLADCDLSEPQD